MVRRTRRALWRRQTDAETAQLRGKIDHLRELVPTAVDVLVRAERQDEATRLRATEATDLHLSSLM